MSRTASQSSHSARRYTVSRHASHCPPPSTPLSDYSPARLADHAAGTTSRPPASMTSRSAPRGPCSEGRVYRYLGIEARVRRQRSNTTRECSREHTGFESQIVFALLLSDFKTHPQSYFHVPYELTFPAAVSSSIENTECRRARGPATLSRYLLEVESAAAIC